VFNYIKTGNTAKKLIKNFGKQVTINRKNDPVYNPATGEVETNDISFVVDAVDFAMNGDEFGSQVMVQSGDRYALISPDATSILINDKYNEYTVLQVQELRPANDLVMWKVMLRK
jgi:hypothetical protein